MGHLGGLSPIGPGEAVSAQQGSGPCSLKDMRGSRVDGSHSSLGVELHLASHSGRDTAAV